MRQKKPLESNKEAIKAVDNQVVINEAKPKTMTKVAITKTNPVFVAGVKSEMAAKKQRFSRYFSIISGTKENTITKLIQMKGA